MKIILKIFGWLIFYAFLAALICISLVMYWSYGEKKKIPARFISKIEDVFEGTGFNTQTFIGDAEIEFVSFSEGFGVNLSNSYIEFDKDAVASIPEMKVKIKPLDLLSGKLRFREIDLKNPKFVISDKISAEEFSKSASQDFFNIYKAVIYKLFSRVDKNQNAIPAEKIDMEKALFSFNRDGKYETWKVENANMRFYTLQNTTYLSTYIKTKLLGKKSEVTINARLLDEDRMLLKIDYTNVSSKAVSSFIQGLDWFNALKPTLNGTSAVLMEKGGVSTSISLDTEITYAKPEIADTKIGFKGIFDLSQNENGIMQPKVHGEVALKDINMQKLPILWPDKYGTKVRAEVLKNYTKGTFNDVAINFDYSFADPEFVNVLSEKFSITGNIVDTDVIYNPEFPPVEKASGKFSYDGDNVEVQLTKGFIGGLEFLPTKVRIQGINDAKTILELDGNAKGDLVALRPLLKSILKGRDEKFFYNTREIKSDAEIKFYYKDNINFGFDPDILKLDINAKLNNVEIKNVLEDVNLKSSNLEMKINNEGLRLNGEVDLNNSPSDIKVFVGFLKDNQVELNVVSDPEVFVLDRMFPGVAKYMDGVLELEFQYKSLGARNYFAGKVDSVDASINFPHLAWEKPKGTFASISFGGKYIADRAVEVSELQIVSSESVSSGNMIISLNDAIPSEVYFSKLALGGNDAELYFNINKQKVAEGKSQDSYIIKVNGNSFNASRVMDLVHNLATSKKAMVFDMDVKNLLMSNDVRFGNVKASIRCNFDRCVSANFNADISNGGKLSAYQKPDNSSATAEVFEIRSDNAGEVIKGFGISSNIEKGSMTIQGDVNKTVPGETNGIIEVKDFRLTKAPVITRILSLASFTGLLDLLTGTGVPMSRLKGNYKLKDNYLSISNLKSYGNSLGFTVQGNVNLKTSEVDLTGAVTPSYSVNTVFGDIPLIGGIFKGREGEGLIATNYSVKGVYPNVDVSVNPFSALTPGFLRKIWGSAETDIDKMSEEDKKAQALEKKQIKPKGH